MSRSFNDPITRSPDHPITPDRYAIIAGNRHFPFLVLEAARDQGLEPWWLSRKKRRRSLPRRRGKSIGSVWGKWPSVLTCWWRKQVSKIVLAGQVKHAQLFSAIKPDGHDEPHVARALAEEHPRSSLAPSCAGRARHEGGGFHTISQAAAGGSWSSRGALQMAPTRRPISPMAAISPRRLRGWTSARRSWWLHGRSLAWPWRLWRVPTPPSSAPPA